MKYLEILIRPKEGAKKSSERIQNKSLSFTEYISRLIYKLMLQQLKCSTHTRYTFGMGAS